ncbi:MAG: hypothetical protein A2096_15070 [Spirochaetes bacterium GWF1_41_5]|nr:MAG: hypothetical protein A2096_15070 [Spirochaetes bacterium GWF1_41_5]
MGIPVGLFGGALSGAFGAGGPPVVAYTASQDFEKHRYVACVQVVLAIGAASRIIFLGINGAFTGEIVSLSISGVFFAMSEAWGGAILLRKISDNFLRITINALLLFLSVKYCLF